jgi:Tol biopolymer transport system component
MVLVLILTIPGCSRDQPVSKTTPIIIKVSDRTTVLAAIGLEQKPTGIDGSIPKKTQYDVYFNESGTGVAYVAQIAGTLHVVHNGRAGMAISGLNQVAISPDGRRIAYSALVNDKWRMIVDDQSGMESDDANNPVFSPDSAHVAYYMRAGEQSFLVLDGRKIPGGPAFNGVPVFSSDSRKIAYAEHLNANGDMRLVIRDTASNKTWVRDSMGSLFAVNGQRTRIAAVRQNGDKQTLQVFSFDEPDRATAGSPFDAITSLAFDDRGESVAFVGVKGGSRYIILNGREERLPAGDLVGSPVIRPDNRAVAVILASDEGFYFHQAFLNTKTGMTKYEDAGEPTYNKEGSVYAYVARKGLDWFVVVNGREGRRYDRVASPLFVGNDVLVYRARKNGRRFVVTADTHGTVLRQHKSYDMLFAPVLTPDGMSIAYGLKDGQNLVWNVHKP